MTKLSETKLSDASRRLLDAVRELDLDALLEALADGAAPNARDADDDTPAILLTEGDGALGVIAALLDAGADLEACDDMGYTALGAAAANGEPEQVDFLLARGADVHQYALHNDEEGTIVTAALQLASVSPERGAIATKVLASLIGAGADVNRARTDGFTPLMIAAQEGPVEHVRMLLDAGADVRAVRAGYVTAMIIADVWRRAEVVELLDHAGATSVVDVYTERMRVLWEEITAWYASHAPSALAYMPPLAGATDADIDALEARIGRRLPSAFRAHLRVHGRGGPYLFEYTTLDVDRIAYVWEMLESLRGEGAFDSYVPCELRDTDEAVERVWWHPGWVPFAEDSCGNLWCVDLAPRGKPGCYGQVIAWETHSGPVGPAGAGFDFCDYLEGHRDKLVEGRAVVMDGGSVIEQ